MPPAMKKMTTRAVRALPVVMTLVQAGEAFGIGRTLSHELVRQGEFPCAVLRIGRNYRVRKADLLKALGVEPEAPRAAVADDAA